MQGRLVGHTLARPLARIAADQPELALREIQELMGHLSRDVFGIQHVNALVGEIQVYLYLGDGVGAGNRMTEVWPQLKRGLHLQLQQVRVVMRVLRGLSAIKAAATAADPKPLQRAAARDARRILREKRAWSDPMARLLQAGVCGVRGETERAMATLAVAEQGFADADMLQFRAVAMRRRGELVGGDEGRALIAEADAWMSKQNIANPARMTAATTW